MEAVTKTTKEVELLPGGEGRSLKKGSDPAIKVSLTSGSGQESSSENDWGLLRVCPYQITTSMKVTQSLPFEVSTVMFLQILLGYQTRAVSFWHKTAKFQVTNAVNCTTKAGKYFNVTGGAQGNCCWKLCRLECKIWVDMKLYLT